MRLSFKLAVLSAVLFCFASAVPLNIEDDVKTLSAGSLNLNGIRRDQSAQLQEEQMMSQIDKKNVQNVNTAAELDKEEAEMKKAESKKEVKIEREQEEVKKKIGEREAESTTTTTTTTTVRPTTTVEAAVQLDESAALLEREDMSSSNTSQWSVNPCESNKNFNYFQAHPRDESRYIQCDPWGTGIVRECANGTIWNAWSLKCTGRDTIRNLTLAVPPQRVFNCSSVGMQECLNEAVCSDSVLGGYRCVCKPDFTGQFCETRVDLTDITHDILNATFSLALFKQRLVELNFTSDAQQYLRYKDQMDNTTYGELMAYVSLYNETDIRYDTLVNNLVEAVLESIYPDAAYLSAFNASSVSVVELVRLIPNLLSYSKYSMERCQEVFAKYQSVLTHLVRQLNTTEPRLRQESLQYTRLTAVFMNQTLALLNQTSSGQSSISNSENVQALIDSQQSQSAHTRMNETQVRELLREQYKETLRATEKLYESLEKFQKGVVEEYEKNQEKVYRLTLAESKIEGSQDVLRLLDGITTASVQIWDSLVNYGFWFVTSVLSTPASVLAQEQRAIAQALTQVRVNVQKKVIVG